MAYSKYTLIDEHGLQTMLEKSFDHIKTEINGKACFFGECNTDADVAAKIATVDEGFTFAQGVQVVIKMKNYNAVASPTLSINNSTPAYIMRYGNNAPGTQIATSWHDGSVVMFIYDGTYWQMLGFLNDYYDLADTSTSGLMSNVDKGFLDNLSLTQEQFETLDALLDGDDT